MADPRQVLANLDRAMAELESYAALPIVHRRDKAGLIQAFEFTFELFWKTFQKLAPDAGLEAASPREAASPSRAGTKERPASTRALAPSFGSLTPARRFPLHLLLPAAASSSAHRMAGCIASAENSGRGREPRSCPQTLFNN